MATIEVTTLDEALPQAVAEPEVQPAEAGTPEHPVWTGEQPKSVDPTRLRHCTFPGCPDHYLPATDEFWPTRKSGDAAGTFIGWDRRCQRRSAARHKAEPTRIGTRSNYVGRTVQVVADIRLSGRSDVLRSYSAARDGSGPLPQKVDKPPKAPKAKKVSAAEAEAAKLRAELEALKAQLAEQAKPTRARKAK